MKNRKASIALLLALTLAVGLLAGCGQTKSSAYEVLVTDGAGKPVVGAVIQFCSDAECVMDKTGDDGIAHFEKSAGSYTVHVLKAPEGYTADSTEYAAPAQPGRVSIVLK